MKSSPNSFPIFPNFHFLPKFPIFFVHNFQLFLAKLPIFFSKFLSSNFQFQISNFKLSIFNFNMQITIEVQALMVCRCSSPVYLTYSLKSTKAPPDVKEIIELKIFQDDLCDIAKKNLSSDIEKNDLRNIEINATPRMKSVSIFVLTNEIVLFLL